MSICKRNGTKTQNDVNIEDDAGGLYTEQQNTMCIMQHTSLKSAELIGRVLLQQ